MLRLRAIAKIQVEGDALDGSNWAALRQIETMGQLGICLAHFAAKKTYEVAPDATPANVRALKIHTALFLAEVHANKNRIPEASVHSAAAIEVYRRVRASIGDVFASIYRGLGIDPSTQVRDAIGRPFPIAGLNGRPLAPLFA